MNFVRSQSGSVIMQGMMALGLISLMSYGVMTYQSSSNMENRIQKNQNDIDSAAQILSALAAVPNLCNTNVFLRAPFVLPANPATDVAPNQELVVNIGAATTGRPGWIDGVMGAAAPTSVPGRITEFETVISGVALSGARFKRNTTTTNQIWVGDLVVYAQKTNAGALATTGKRVVAQMELEIDAAGNKVNCSTSASVASVCRDLGGVYDPVGVPNCLFAMQAMDCSSAGPDGYVHDIVAGSPVCKSAARNCPSGYFAAGIVDGDLQCVRLSRRVNIASPSPVLPTPPPPPPTPSTCTGPGLTQRSGGVYPGGETCNTLGDTNGICSSYGEGFAFCDNSVDTYTLCCSAAAPPPPPPTPGPPVACYIRDKGIGAPPLCDTQSLYFGTLTACQSAVLPGGPCSMYNDPPSACGEVLVGSPAAVNCPAPPAPSTLFWRIAGAGGGATFNSNDCAGMGTTPFFDFLYAVPPYDSPAIQSAKPKTPFNCPVAGAGCTITVGTAGYGSTSAGGPGPGAGYGAGFVCTSY